MSIIPSMALLLMLSTVMLVSPPVAHAQAVRYIVRHASQLADDKEVKRINDAYVSASTANVVYAQCATQLGITENDAQYLAKHFDRVGTNYMKALDNAFKTRTGGAAPEALLQNYVDYMRAIQQKTVDNTALLIKKHGCTTTAFKKLFTYYYTLQKTEEAAQSAPAVITP